MESHRKFIFLWSLALGYIFLAHQTFVWWNIYPGANDYKKWTSSEPILNEWNKIIMENTN